MSAQPFHLQKHLDRLYSTSTRKFAFNARTLEEYFQWQSAFRAELNHLLGLQNHSPASLDLQEINRFDYGAYIEEKYALDVGEGVQVPLYVLIPKREPPYQPILVFHRHDPSAQYCLGHYPDEETARANLALDNNYAQALAEMGDLAALLAPRPFCTLNGQKDEIYPIAHVQG